MTTATARRAPVRVAVVDDDENIAILFPMMLHRAGFAVGPVFQDAASAMENPAVWEGIEVALLDYSMPGGTGAEVARWLRDHAATPPVLILVTAYLHSEIPPEDRAVFDAHLQKAIDPDRLIAAMRAALRPKEDRKW